MELDLETKRYIESLADGIKSSELKENAQKISERYLSNIGVNDRYIFNDRLALTYAIMRLPATYSALNSALSHTLEVSNFRIKSVLDLGAGMGTAALALNDLLQENIEYTLIERESSMIDLGKKILSYKNIKYRYVRDDILQYVPNQKYDLVLLGYSLNEFDETNQIKIVEKYLPVSNLLIIVDPGTPLCFLHLRKIKDYVSGLNYHIVAPCAFKANCPLNGDDWCHFVTRVSRSSLHKYLKDAEVPYEDEKFTYLAISSADANYDFKRILRHPKINSNSVSLSLCTKQGIENTEIFKGQKELYKAVKKSDAGDIIK